MIMIIVLLINVKDLNEAKYQYLNQYLNVLFKCTTQSENLIY